MRQYDVKCPICGVLNKGLYLEETDGWMICDHCGTEVQDTAFRCRHSHTPAMTMPRTGHRVPVLGVITT